MGLSPLAAARTAAGVLLLLALLAPSASAQLPAEVAGHALAITVVCNDTLLEPTYAGQDTVSCVLQDLSRDGVVAPGSTSGSGVTPHTVFISAQPRGESVDAEGWQVLPAPAVIPLYGGDVIPFDVNVKATPLINTQDYHFDIVAEYVHSAGYNQTIVVPFTAEVERYDFALVSWGGPQVQKAGQDDVVVYTVAVTNTGVYPDTFRFTVKTDPDIRVSVPPSLYVPPGETRHANISILTPHGKLYEIGRSVPINIKVQSVTGSGLYSTVGVLQMRGAYVPLYWIPLLVIGLTSAGILARSSSEKAEMRRLEKGGPRRVELTPRQAVLLAELRRSNPEAYKEKKAALDNVYKERRADYRAHRKERLAADREEARQARQEFIAAKKARRAQRKEERKQAKLARKEQKRLAKIQRKEDKKEAKLLKKKQKVLDKKRKKLEKAKAKAEKKEAKLAAKQAKADAKAQKAAERERKKAEKAARKKP